MEFDLKGKMADVAGDTLKNVGDSNGKLSNENTESAQKLTNKTTRVALETGKAVGDKLVNKRQKAPETNKQAANRILLHEDTVTESAGATLHTSNGKSKLMTASRRRRVRDKQAVNDIKLLDNRKKLQKKLRQQYEIKATVKGGLKQTFRWKSVQRVKCTKVQSMPVFQVQRHLGNGHFTWRTIWQMMKKDWVYRTHGRTQHQRLRMRYQLYIRYRKQRNTGGCRRTRRKSQSS